MSMNHPVADHTHICHLLTRCEDLAMVPTYSEHDQSSQQGLSYVSIQFSFTS